MADPIPFLRGVAWPGTEEVPYPRADPTDGRLPRDSWARACSPLGVRLEWVGGDGEVAIELSDGTRELVPAADGVHHLTDTAGVAVRSIESLGAPIEPPPASPRWIAYGDSITEGWVATEPKGAWPAIAARSLGLDVVNMGYAGAGRGEIASAEQIANVEAAVITVMFATNCWTMTPHPVGMFAEVVSAFLTAVRQGHPETPIVVVSPILRPDAEDTPNRFGATLADLRSAQEARTEELIAGGDRAMRLVRGLEILDADGLADGIHPGDEGHEALAASIGQEVAAALASTNVG